MAKCGRMNDRYIEGGKTDGGRVTEGKREQKMDSTSQDWFGQEGARGKDGKERTPCRRKKRGDDKSNREEGTDEMKEEKESLHKLLLQPVGQWSIVRA